MSFQERQEVELVCVGSRAEIRKLELKGQSLIWTSESSGVDLENLEIWWKICFGADYKRILHIFWEEMWGQVLNSLEQRLATFFQHSAAWTLICTDWGRIYIFNQNFWSLICVTKESRAAMFMFPHPPQFFKFHLFWSRRCWQGFLNHILWSLILQHPLKNSREGKGGRNSPKEISPACVTPVIWDYIPVELSERKMEMLC